VLTRAGVQALLTRLDGEPWLVAALLYGSGLRLMEALRLRVKDIDLTRHQLTIRDTKGLEGPGHNAPHIADRGCAATVGARPANI
jgi:integrase